MLLDRRARRRKLFTNRDNKRNKSTPLSAGFVDRYLINLALRVHKGPPGDSMYEQFYRLRERPFEMTPNPQYLVLTDGHREAVSSIEYGIATRKGMVLLIGEAGSGKTTVIRTAIERQPVLVQCVHLHNPALTRSEFIELLGAQLDLSRRARRSKAVFLMALQALLQHRHRANETTVLIVDEAQSLSFSLLEEIRLLTSIETYPECSRWWWPASPSWSADSTTTHLSVTSRKSAGEPPLGHVLSPREAEASVLSFLAPTSENVIPETSILASVSRRYFS